MTSTEITTPKARITAKVEQQIADSGMTLAEIVEGVNQMCREHGARGAYYMVSDGHITRTSGGFELGTLSNWLSGHRHGTHRGTITDRQIAAIRRELADNAWTMGEGGWMGGPTKLSDIEAMSREAASAYIESLTGSY